MKKLLGYFLFLLSVISALFGIKFLIVMEWSYSVVPLAMAAIYVFLAAKLLQSQEKAPTDKGSLEKENIGIEQTNVSDNSAIEIDAFEISEMLIGGLESQLAKGRVGTKLNYPDAISGYLYGLTYGYLKAEGKLSKNNHFSLTENIHLGVFGDIDDVLNMLRKHFVNNSFYKTEFGKLVFNHAAEDGFRFATSNGKTVLRLEQVLLVAQKDKAVGFEDALFSLGKGTRAAINFTKENVINPISPSSTDYKRCPFCDEKVKPQAKKCKHCGEWFSQSAEVTKPKTKAIRKMLQKTESPKLKAKTLEKDADTGTAASVVTSEIQLIMREISPSNTAAKFKVQTNDFAIGYLLGYVDGYLQRKQLFETDEVERIAVCTLVFIDIFGHKEGSRIFGVALGQQLDNRHVHLGMRVGGEEGFRQIDPRESSLPKEFLKP